MNQPSSSDVFDSINKYKPNFLKFENESAIIPFGIGNLILEREIIGAGTFGIVRKCIHNESGKEMVVKKVLMPHSKSNKKKVQVERKALLHEIYIHKKLSTISNNIVQYYGWCICDGGVEDDMESIYICMERMDMSLMDLASQYRLKKKDFPVSALGYLSFIIIDTLEQCIKRKIIHRDIKPTNILINKNGLVKLCDFGQARKIIGATKTLKGTIKYWPPECWNNNGKTEYDERRDIWSYGITALELIYGDSPYKDYQGQKIDWIPGLGLERVKNANGRQLVEKCLKGKEKTYAEMKSFLLKTLETYEKRAKYDVLKKDKFIQTYSTWTPEMFKKELELSELMNDSPTTSNRSPMESIDDPQEKKLPPVQEEPMEFQPNNNISSQSDDPSLPLIPPEQNSPRRPSLESQRSNQSNNSRSPLIPPGQESGDPPRGLSLESQRSSQSDNSRSLVIPPGQESGNPLRRPSLESQRSSQSNNSRSLLIPPGQESGDPPRGPSFESQRSNQSNNSRSSLIPPGQESGDPPRGPSLESQRSSQSDNPRSLSVPPGQESRNPPGRPSFESQLNETLSEDSKSRLVSDQQENRVLCHGMPKKWILRSLAIVVFLLLLFSPIYIWYFLLREHEKSETTTTTHSTPSTISPQKCPDSFSYFPPTKACYYVNYGNATWNTARIECRGLLHYSQSLADLVSIHDEAEDKHVKELAPDSKLIAIGLYAADASISGEADYTWMDKTSKTYTHWKIGVPRKEHGEHCVYKEQDGDWNVYDCNMVADIAYVCKYYP